MTTSVYFSTIALISNDILIRLLRYVLDKLIIVLSIASVRVVIKYV